MLEMLRLKQTLGMAALTVLGCICGCSNQSSQPTFSAKTLDGTYASPNGLANVILKREEGKVSLRQESPTGGTLVLTVESEANENWRADWDSIDRLWLVDKNTITISCTDDGRLGLLPPRANDWAKCPESFNHLRPGD